VAPHGGRPLRLSFVPKERNLPESSGNRLIVMKLSIIIPVYNEARTLAILLERVCAQPIASVSKEIIIVESNSTDGSREIVAAFVTLHRGGSTPVRAIYEDGPRGKGHAVRQGFAAARGDILLIQDADLEYDVADYPELITPIVEGRSAFVIGSRHLGREGWKIRKFARGDLRALLMNLGGILFHGFFNALFSSHLTDPTSMYKVMRADCLDGLRFSCNRFDFDFELTGKLIRAGFKPLEVPVSYKSRGFGEGKKIRIFRDPLTWIVAIVKSRLAAVSPTRGVSPAPRSVSAAACGEKLTAKSPPLAHRHRTS
jgi:glycosyltransferase involved in cell wall biosynthesis